MGDGAAVEVMEDGHGLVLEGLNERCLYYDGE